MIEASENYRRLARKFPFKNFAKLSQNISARFGIIKDDSEQTNFDLK